MQKLSLTFQNDIEDELCLLLQNNPRRCRKQSQRGWSVNERVLMVRENCLQYYKVPNDFVQNQTKSLSRQHFKAGIRLELIHQVNFLPESKQLKNVLQVVFPAHFKLLKMSEGDAEQDESEKTQMDGEQHEFWAFEFDYDVKSAIETAQVSKRTEKRTFSSISRLHFLKDDQMSQFMGRFRGTAPSSQENLKIQELANSITKIRSEQQRRAQREAQQLARIEQKKKQDMAKANSMKQTSEEEYYSLDSFWRDYFKHYEVASKGRVKGVGNIDNEIGLLQQMDCFRSNAIKIVKNYIDEMLSGFEPERIMNGQYSYYQGLWLRTGGKELNLLFLVNYYLNDIVYSLGDIRNISLRVPPMALVKYKGFKVLCICNLPFSVFEKTQVYNLNNESCDLQLMNKLKECLEMYEDVLNIRTEPMVGKNMKEIPAPLGKTLRIYEYSSKKMGEEQVSLSNFYYLFQMGMILPLDFHMQGAKPNYTARLRPELVALSRDHSTTTDTHLLSHAFMESRMDGEQKEHENMKVLRASELLTRVAVPALLAKIDSLQLLMVDSYSIKNALGDAGINVRYMHLLSENTRLPYFCQMLLIEALARTVKKEFRTALKATDLHDFQTRKQHLHSLDTASQKAFIKANRGSLTKVFMAMGLDFLNLVFGHGEETGKFWHIVIGKCHDYYKLKVEYPLKVKAGCLLNAVLWHCGLKVQFDESIRLFQTKTPFEKEVVFEPKCKLFDFSSFKVQSLFRKAPEMEELDSQDQFQQVSLKLLRVQLLFKKTLHQQNIQTQITIAKINNFGEYFQKPSLFGGLHPYVIPHYLANKSLANFQRALKVLNFCLPDTHPLYISLYTEYSGMIDSDLLKKTSILQAVKGLGQFHPKTTEIYSKLYNQDEFREYRLEAHRVKELHGLEIINWEYYSQQDYDNCFLHSLDCIRIINDPYAEEKLNLLNFKQYLAVLSRGIDSAIRLSELQKGLHLSREMSSVLSSFSTKEYFYDEQLLRQTLIIHLMRSGKKYFLYKMVLLTIHIREKHEGAICEQVLDGEPCMEPVDQDQRVTLIREFINVYYESGNHSDWVQNTLVRITNSFQYFNYLDDLFNNFQYHFKRYNNQDFKESFSYLDVLVRLFGQKLFKQHLYDI